MSTTPYDFLLYDDICYSFPTFKYVLAQAFMGADGGWFLELRRHGWRRRAYMDVFTAFPETNHHLRQNGTMPKKNFDCRFYFVLIEFFKRENATTQ